MQSIDQLPISHVRLALGKKKSFKNIWQKDWALPFNSLWYNAKCFRKMHFDCIWSYVNHLLNQFLSPFCTLLLVFIFYFVRPIEKPQ